MLNVPELEKKWLTYKLKSFIPHIILTVALIVIMPLAIVFYPSNEPLKETAKIDKTILPSKNKNVEANTEIAVIKQDINSSVATKEDDKLVLKPSLNFVNTIEDSMVTYYDDNKHTKKTETKQASKTTVSTTTQTNIKNSVKVVEKKNEPVQKEKSSEITIRMQSVDKNMQDVIQRFKKTNNPVLSLFLAKKYYEMKKYDLSYNYALITNQIDNKIDMSWIIFAKSLVKLGQKDMAVNTLKSYIKNSNSQTAITLLDEIESGRFQ